MLLEICYHDDAKRDATKNLLLAAVCLRWVEAMLRAMNYVQCKCLPDTSMIEEAEEMFHSVGQCLAPSMLWIVYSASCCATDYPSVKLPHW